MAFSIATRSTSLLGQRECQLFIASSFHSTSRPYCRISESPPRELINQSRVRGIDIIRNPKTNKGNAFTLKERQIMGIHGLLPPNIIDQDQQLHRVLENVRKRANDLDRYIYLNALQDRNERLFYRAICENVEEMMPIVYTPTVGQACQHYGMVFRRPRGLFISINDMGHLYEMLCNWPESDIKAIVVTDGERILGLGDLGAYGMGIPVGKLSLYTALGGIAPEHCLPIHLDCGTNNDKIRDDPLYIGLQQTRVRGEKYDAFIDEFMEAAVRRFGQNTLIQFEDFGNQNAFRFLEKYRDRYCVFNDDIQGTAAVAAAGVIASMRITKRKLSDNVFLFQGAGEANIGIAELLALAMVEEGLTKEQAYSKIWMVDSKGLIIKNRPDGGITRHKEPFTKEHKSIKELGEIVKDLKPSILIGAAAIPKVFTEEIIRDMASFNERPVIFALSNPTSMAECTAEEAYKYSDGRAVFASGSPFKAVTYNGKTFHPGQGNNAYIFPGVALGVVYCGVRHIGEAIFLKAAEELASLVTDEHLSEGRVYPPLSQIREVSLRIATSIANYAYPKGLASTYPEPADKESYLRERVYSYDYESFVPSQWDWPDSK